MAERLTDRSIASLKPTGRSVLHFDSAVRGLALRIYGSGQKSFVFIWRDELGRQRRVTIGAPPVWTIGKARTHASQLRLKADVGESVTPRRGGRLDALVEQWLAVVAVTRRPRTADKYRRQINRHVVPVFGAFDPRSIGRNAIESWHGAIAQRTPVEANRVLTTLGVFFHWLEHDGKITNNPVRGVRKAAEAPRQVFLSAEEIEAAHAALDAERKHRAAALALKLALLTGARIGEVVSLTADQIDVGRRIWCKPYRLTKQKRDHIVPLQDEALAVAQALLASGDAITVRHCRTVWEKIRVAIGRPDVVIHDLRHSRASALARAGGTLLQIGKVLGHANPSTTAKYAHLVDKDLVALVERTR